MQSPIVPVLLAGGTGTRLWPMSRDSLPKQFLPLMGKRSTYQEALLRVSDRTIFTEPIVVTAEDLRFFALRQAEEVGVKAAVVIEPMRRDSAAAIAAGTMIARIRYPDAVVLSLAADHIILDPDKFREACMQGRIAAEYGRIVTFGIRPTAPMTSYGYILPGALLEGMPARAVEQFVEKPNAASASDFVRRGFLWNSGNFLFQAESILADIERYEPEIAVAVSEAVAAAKHDLDFLRLDAAAFEASPQKSIDRAVMEKTDRAAVVVGDFRWSDIGSWQALFDIAPKDDDGNVVRGKAVVIDSQNCLVRSETQLIALVGVQDLVVVSTTDAVLIMPRSRSQEVREVVARLKNENRSEATVHRRIHRPWGFYESIDVGERFQVKRIVVTPGGMLSLQRHRHRAEHWVVVRGTAEVTIGDVTRAVHENESTYIPIGCVHRLANRGKIPVELIEVQTGSYLGEDDIERLDDIYRR